jgi:hypothetical protein
VIGDVYRCTACGKNVPDNGDGPMWAIRFHYCGASTAPNRCPDHRHQHELCSSCAEAIAAVLYKRDRAARAAS